MFFLNNVIGFSPENCFYWHSRQLMAGLVFTFEYKGGEHTGHFWEGQMVTALGQGAEVCVPPPPAGHTLSKGNIPPP